MSEVLYKAAFVFKGMKQRCYSLNNKAFKNYGGRGITICDKWLNNPDDFILWYKDKYFEGCQVDRINVNDSYSEENCRLVFPVQNNRNRRSTLRLEAFGETKTHGEWAEDSRAGDRVTAKIINSRLRKGWSSEEAVATAMQAPGHTRSAPLYTGFGETKTLHEWSIDSRCVVKKGTLWYRLKNNWDLEKAVTSNGRSRPGSRFETKS